MTQRDTPIHPADGTEPDGLPGRPRTPSRRLMSAWALCGLANAAAAVWGAVLIVLALVRNHRDPHGLDLLGLLLGVPVFAVTLVLTILYVIGLRGARQRLGRGWVPAIVACLLGALAWGTYAWDVHAQWVRQDLSGAAYSVAQWLVPAVAALVQLIVAAWTLLAHNSTHSARGEAHRPH